MARSGRRITTRVALQRSIKRPVKAFPEPARLYWFVVEGKPRVSVAARPEQSTRGHEPKKAHNHGAGSSEIAVNERHSTRRRRARTVLSGRRRHNDDDGASFDERDCGWGIR